jgi:hypothetical protein
MSIISSNSRWLLRVSQALEEEIYRSRFSFGVDTTSHRHITALYLNYFYLTGVLIDG